MPARAIGVNAVTDSLGLNRSGDDIGSNRDAGGIIGNAADHLPQILRYDWPYPAVHPARSD